MNKTRQTVMAPEAPFDSNVIWIDTSSNEPIQKVFLNGEWKPLKDSDVEAEFHTGEKVSDISLEKTSGTSADNSKIATVAKVNETLEGYHERATYKDWAPILEDTNYVIEIPYCRTNENIVVNQDGSDHDADVITLVKTTAPNTTDSVTTIRFKSTSTPTSIDYDEDDLLWANDELPICEENAEYLIAIWNNIGVMTKLNTIETSNS